MAKQVFYRRIRRIEPLQVGNNNFINNSDDFGLAHSLVELREQFMVLVPVRH